MYDTFIYIFYYLHLLIVDKKSKALYIKGAIFNFVNTKILLKKLEGVQTIKSVMSILDVNKEKAVYHIYRLRKAGYVKTRKSSNNARVYSISSENRLGGTSYYEIINKHSPIKISTPRVYRVYGKEHIIEEALVFAIKTQNLRTILAALSLFRKIEDWAMLYRLAKKNCIERQVGALYDLARTVMRVRKMPKRFRNNALPKKEHTFKHVIDGLKSKDFKDIEARWKMHLPFNKKDLEDYR